VSVHPTRFAAEAQPGPAGPLVRMSGELDIASVPQAEHALEEAIASTSGDVVVDLRELTFIDSSGLRLFILLSQRARADGWRLALVPPPEPARTVFRLTGAEENLPFVAEPPRS
jgi:anti-anti-sigma factor